MAIKRRRAPITGVNMRRGSTSIMGLGGGRRINMGRSLTKRGRDRFKELRGGRRRRR